MKKAKGFSPLKYVFSKWNYTLSAALIAIFFYVFNVVITNRKTFFSFLNILGFWGSIKFLFSLSINFYQTIKPASFIALIITSILIGVLISLIAFKINLKASPKKGTSAFGLVGILIASLAPGCAACGIGLISVLGVSAATLTFLPYDGLEISILAILILIYTIHRTAKDLITCEECKIL